jgi:hypothetical protein
VEYFHELWRKHREGDGGAPNGFDNVAPPRLSPAIRASNMRVSEIPEQPRTSHESTKLGYVINNNENSQHIFVRHNITAT